jgi:hypothetical protein
MENMLKPLNCGAVVFSVLVAGVDRHECLVSVATVLVE